MKSLIQSIAMLLAAVLAAPVLAQETAVTALNQFVEVAGNRITYRTFGRGTLTLPE
jgi:hypothetical protein